MKTWQTNYYAPTMPDDVAEEVLRSGFLDPYDMAYTIMQGPVLAVWPMRRSMRTVPVDGGKGTPNASVDEARSRDVRVRTPSKRLAARRRLEAHRRGDGLE